MRYVGVFLISFCFVLIGCDRKVSFFLPSSSYVQFLHNYERMTRDDPVLWKDEKLSELATSHAEWMASRERLVHQDLPIRSLGLALMGENIAMGTADEDKVTKMWMNSPGHRANILNGRFRKVGVAYAFSSDGVAYWCVVFGGLVLLRKYKYEIRDHERSDES